jgi:hypothetical protein
MITNLTMEGVSSKKASHSTFIGPLVHAACTHICGHIIPRPKQSLTYLCLKHTNMYSLHLKIKVMFGHKLSYKIKVTCGEFSLKLRQTNWNVARIIVNVVVDEPSSQITYYTYLTIDIWTRRHRRTST